MSDVVNRTTKEFRRSVNTPEFPVADWIINPDLSAVLNFPTKYWTISRDKISLMNATERGVVDTASAAKVTAERVAEDDRIFDAYERARMRRA